MKIAKIAGLVCAAALLLAAVREWPDGYYRPFRIGVTIAAACIAFAAYEKNKQGWFWCMVFAAILFNPWAPVHFEGMVWKAIYIVSALAFFMASKLP